MYEDKLYIANCGKLPVTDGVTDAEKRVLEALLNDPGYSYAALAKNLSLSRKTVAERIKKLKEKFDGGFL